MKRRRPDMDELEYKKFDGLPPAAMHDEDEDEDEGVTRLPLSCGP
jgi:hypothetical protein